MDGINIFRCDVFGEQVLYANDIVNEIEIHLQSIFQNIEDLDDHVKGDEVAFRVDERIQSLSQNIKDFKIDFIS